MSAQRRVGVLSSDLVGIDKWDRLKIGGRNVFVVVGESFFRITAFQVPEGVLTTPAMGLRYNARKRALYRNHIWDANKA